MSSGLSYHNMRGFNAAGAEASRQFDKWLTRTLCEEPPHDRTADLAKWQDAPAARQAHPREEHLIPLMVAIGAAESEKGHHALPRGLVSRWRNGFELPLWRACEVIRSSHSQAIPYDRDSYEDAASSTCARRGLGYSR